jgi:predicted RNA-binding protein
MYNIVSFGKKTENLEKAIEHKTIGSKLNTFGENISDGSVLFLHCEGKIWGTAQAVGNCYNSEQVLWEDKIYPKRFKIQNIKLAKAPISIKDGVINLKFRQSFGTAWAYKFIFSPKPIPTEIANLILNKLEHQ